MNKVVVITMLPIILLTMRDNALVVMLMHSTITRYTNIVSHVTSKSCKSFIAVYKTTSTMKT